VNFYLYRMKLRELTDWLESIAPLSTQESYDNSGLLVGNGNSHTKKVLVSLDCTEAVVGEAIKKKCDLIISHHPLIFHPVKSLTGKNDAERALMKAIRNGIAIYAIHTNLDNSSRGVNRKIGEKLGIKKMTVLSPKTGTLIKISVFCPENAAERVKDAMFSAGAGNIGDYSQCSFSTAGTGTFYGNTRSNPAVGSRRKREVVPEIKLEVVASERILKGLLDAMKAAHPYEEVAFDCYPLLNKDTSTGSGMIGNLDQPIDYKTILKKLKSSFKCASIRHTACDKSAIQRIAWCGGSGSFLIEDARIQGADVYITSDLKYHDFFRSDDQMSLVDLGHYESEQFTIQLIAELIQEKFPTFAPCFTEINTNPIHYF